MNYRVLGADVTSLITHNRVTMRMADILYGVTMGKEGRSHILSVELEEAEELVEESPAQA